MNNKVPVLILAFNRADHVAKVMEVMREYKPDRLYLECDGARHNKEGERESVEETRRVMLDMVNWQCEVKTLFRNENYGCAKGVNDAISWFFEHEEYGIICEDDIVLSLDFFRLCEDLLPRYANSEKIMQISARNQSYRTDIDDTYVYTQCFYCWGWATWRRAWMKMDMSMSSINRMSFSYLIKRLGVFRGIKMHHNFISGYKKLETFSSWATRWYMSILDNDGLVICAGPNLAQNIGLESGEHFSKNKFDLYSKLKVGNIKWPIVYNDTLCVDRKQTKCESRDYLRVKLYGLLNKITTVPLKYYVV